MASFWFSASLRIHGAPHLHPEIIATLGSGEKWPNDIWLLSSEVPEMQDISDHLRWIVDFLQPFEADILRWTSQGATADIYMSYCCDEDHQGFGLPPDLLAIFSRLNLRLEVSIMT